MFKLLYAMLVQCYMRLFDQIRICLITMSIYDVSTTAGVFLPIHSSSGPKRYHILSFRSQYNYYTHYNYT